VLHYDAASRKHAAVWCGSSGAATATAGWLHLRLCCAWDFILRVILACFFSSCACGAGLRRFKGATSQYEPWMYSCSLPTSSLCSTTIVLTASLMLIMPR